MTNQDDNEADKENNTNNSSESAGAGAAIFGGIGLILAKIFIVLSKSVKIGAIASVSGSSVSHFAPELAASVKTAAKEAVASVSSSSTSHFAPELAAPINSATKEMAGAIENKLSPPMHLSKSEIPSNPDEFYTGNQDSLAGAGKLRPQNGSEYRHYSEDYKSSSQNKAIETVELAAVHDNRVKLYDYDALPDNLKADADKTVEYNLSHLAIIPENSAAYKGIFGKVPTAKELNATLSDLSKIKKKDNIKFAGSDVSRASIEKMIRESEKNFISIIGHNDSGILRLPHKPDVSIYELSEVCAQVAKKCIFISCESDLYVNPSSGNIGIKSVIRYDDAIEIVEHLNIELTRLSATNISPHQMVSIISAISQKSISKNRFRLRAKFIVVRTTIGLTIAGISVELEHIND